VFRDRVFLGHARRLRYRRRGTVVAADADGFRHLQRLLDEVGPDERLRLRLVLLASPRDPGGVGGDDVVPPEQAPGRAEAEGEVDDVVVLEERAVSGALVGGRWKKRARNGGGARDDR
jgi:hypothetical protein